MKKRALLALFAALFAFTPTGEGYERPPGQMEIPEKLYQWVQSTDRTNYFFNREHIYYRYDKETGKIDFNKLYVAVLKSYDGIRVQDVKEKRRWNEEPLEGFELLAGEANYYWFDITERTATLEKFQYLTYNQSILEEKYPNTEQIIDKMPEKNVDRRFFESILAYEEENFEKILQNTGDGKKFSEKEIKQFVKEHKKFRKHLDKLRAEKAKDTQND